LDSRKKFIFRPEFLSSETFFGRPKQETRKGQTEPNPAISVDMVLFARNCHLKTLCRLCYMWPCIVRIHDQRPFTSLSTPSNDLGETISDIISGREYLSFWHDMTWHQQLGIHGDPKRTLASILGSESCASLDQDVISIWQPDYLMI
jgi:hypothetical protein